MGINVSKCKYYNNGKCERYEDHVEADYYDYIVKCICDHENCFGDYDICDYQELQQLKAENEELRKENQEMYKIGCENFVAIEQAKRLYKLNKCLDEIYNILDTYGYNGIELSIEKQEYILQKIKEVKENE